MSVLFINLYHGRDNIEELLDGWGYEGPVIGPVQISWVYGAIRVHPPNWEDFVFLPVTENNLIQINKSFYGDFEVWHDSHPLLLKSIVGGRQLFGYDEFRKLISSH